MPDSNQKIVQYLNEAHASEMGLVRVLQSQIAMTPRGSYRDGLEKHLRETRDHADRVQERIRALGDGASVLQAGIGLAETVAAQALAFGKTPLDLLRGSGGEEKVLKNAKDACATEALEIATYTSIERLATSVGDEETARLAASIRADEERMLERVLTEIPKLTDAVVGADVHGNGSYDVTKTGAADATRAAAEATRSGAADVTGAAADATRSAAGAARSGAAGATRSAAGATRSAAGATRTAAKKSSAGRSTRTSARKRPAGRTTRTTAAKSSPARATRTTAQPRSAATQSARTGAARAEGSAKGSGATAQELPIPRYDSLKVDEITTRLPELSQADLAKVESHERKNENRTTVLDRIRTLRASEPWPGYDELNVDEIRSALEQADDDRARATRTYERAHKNRAGVIAATERELANA